jgi:hypothetical protein
MTALPIRPGPSSVAFLPRTPFTRPYQDDVRDPRQDAFTLRALALRSDGVIEVGSNGELARLARSARLPFVDTERALDAATWLGLGAPIAGEGLYRFFEVPS